MIISRIARAFVIRHCVDLEAAVRYAPLGFHGAARARVVTDTVDSFNSPDKVMSARLCDSGEGLPWKLRVKGKNYRYSDISEHEGYLSMYDISLPDSFIPYVENNEVLLTDIMSSQGGEAPFYLQPAVKVRRLRCSNGKHPYSRKDCSIVSFIIEF